MENQISGIIAQAQPILNQITGYDELIDSHGADILAVKEGMNLDGMQITIGLQQDWIETYVGTDGAEESYFYPQPLTKNAYIESIEYFGKVEGNIYLLFGKITDTGITVTASIPAAIVVGRGSISINRNLQPSDIIGYRNDTGKFGYRSGNENVYTITGSAAVGKTYNVAAASRARSLEEILKISSL